MRSAVAIIATALIPFSLMSPALAGEPYFVGDWQVKVNTQNTNITATTINDSGNEFGRVCYFENRECGWAMLSKTPCKKDVETPVLVNSDSGAWQLTVKCTLSARTGYVLSFTSQDEFSRISQNDLYVGIAFPLESGKFLVTRFSLNGADQAIKDIDAVMADSKPSTKDMVL